MWAASHLRDSLLFRLHCSRGLALQEPDLSSVRPYLRIGYVAALHGCSLCGLGLWWLSCCSQSCSGALTDCIHCEAAV